MGVAVYHFSSVQYSGPSYQGLGLGNIAATQGDFDFLARCSLP